MWARWKNQSSFRKILFGLFFLCAVAGGTFVWSAARDARRTAELNSRLAGQLQQSQSASEALPFDDQTPVYPTDFRKEQSGVLTKYVSLKEQYENFVGWITVPQTKYIDMPVVQAADNDYYLKNGIDGKYNWYGAIFMDCGNDPVELGRNTFVYGHNMGDGKMFAELTYYKKESFAKAVPSFYFSTLTDEYDCYVFSAYNVYPDNWRLYDITFEDDADFMDFVGDALERSVFDFGVEVTAEDKIISLSTCDYVYKNARMLVHAVLRRR